ncbi:hypothetical protein FNV43_RR17526 [Rhamnella rubrinervis]|uniref:Uncharacterized protein n=1 Tax=Rhamnella rubrinervis TaxID=2594499 RepID=A0A8K0DXP7_9ROSA|nr:hypothetical protein FNV43_RR17526 [Rhamnella rubrinervis]
MQQQMELKEELKNMEDQLCAAEEERDQALTELGTKKKMAEEEANKRRREEKSMHNSMKEMLSNAKEELKSKERLIESLKLELEKSKELELKLAEKDTSLNTLKEQLAIAKASEAHAVALLSEREKQIRELETEVEKGKQAEKKMFDSLITQTEQLEETKDLLGESKIEIESLCQKVEKLEHSSGKVSGDVNESQNGLDNKAFVNFNSELQWAKDNLANAEKSEKLAWDKTRSLLLEMNSLKNQLKSASEAEENSKKALDDLALALKEVATEANQVKEKLGLAQAELEHSKGEEDRLSLILKSTEEKYKGLLDDARKEAELYRNTAERLRAEAEETLHAWNGKETGLVDCIKRAEEERFEAQQETSRLGDLLSEAEKKTLASKEENTKLRDILKQALNEANVAKEASGIAREENSQLKDILAEKEKTLNVLIQENENYRVNEEAALEHVKELKRLLYETSMVKESKKEEKEKMPSTKESRKDEKEKMPSAKELKMEEKEKTPTHSKEFKKEEKEKTPTHSKESKKEDHKEKSHPKEFKEDNKEKTPSSKELKKEDKVEAGHKLKASNSVDKEEKDGNQPGNTLILNLKELKIPNKHEDGDDDSENIDEALKGSIFDYTDTPNSEMNDHNHPHHHHQNKSSALTDDGEVIHSDDSDNPDENHSDDHDMENERSSRKKKALIWRFGDLLKKRSTHAHRKEPSIE